MNTPLIGWQSTDPVPEDYYFNDYLHVKNGRLYLADLDLAALYEEGGHGLGPVSSPLELVYLPIIKDKIAQLQAVFDKAISATGYGGAFHYAYASKANAAEEVIRTTLAAGAHHEMSSNIDVNIAKLMIAQGLLQPDKMVIANGFKAAGSAYAENLLRLKKKHDNLIPVLEDLSEISPFLGAGVPFEVGLRYKSYSPSAEEIAEGTADSRFGFSRQDLWKAADYISAAPNLSLKMLHVMVGGQITDVEAFIGRLRPGMVLYAQLKRRFPTLSIFNFGGGVPVPLTLDFAFDYDAFATQMLQAMQAVCAEYQVAVPDIMGEMGRYTTAEHGAHLFQIVTAKENNSPTPWYILNGSVMSSFPDVWALGELFIVLPLNHLDQPFQRVQLGGITCDSDDIYPPKKSTAALYLPVETEGLHIGFFGIGAYQEMLGGARGSKHCVLPEADELVVQSYDAENGRFQFRTIHGQSTAEVLANLGYHVEG
jgi:arginine decarboxylase